jgi:TetR/AcrR family transcriptional regulator, transcriptional repressor for nem operon
MGRNKEFEVDVALERALRVFWRKGFEGTSMNDLVDAMEIQRASIYATFGSKAELYEQAILAYQSKGLRALSALLSEEAAPLEVLRKALQTAIPVEACQASGCFCLNATLEVAPHDPKLRDLLRSHFDKVEAVFARIVAKGQADGTISLRWSPIEAGKYLIACLNGLHVAANTEKNPSQMNTTIDLALAALAP